MDTIINQEWSRISTELVQNPDDLNLWQLLIKAAESNTKRGITKSSGFEEIDVLRVSYQKLLQKYPLLYNYWIKFAEWEFHLGDTDRANQVYQSSLKHLSYSCEIWTSYLNFKINTSNGNLDEVLGLFELARRKIGYHFHAYEFYKLYLSFLENYQTETENFKLKYYVLLRIIVEIPLYHYEYFYKKLFDTFAEIGNDEKRANELVPLVVPEKELKNYKTSENKQLALHLKKTFVDAYLTTQFKVYELFNFEKHITRQYYDTSSISSQQLENWDMYLDFLELREYPNDYIIFTYERCLIPTASYARFWTKYSDYYINQGNHLKAAEVLVRGYNYSGQHSLLLKLVDLQIYLHNFTKARDMILAFIKTNASVPLPIYEKLINIERFLHPGDNDYIIGLFREIIRETQNEWLFQHLLYYSIPNELKKELLDEFETFKESPIYIDALEKLKSEINSTNKKESPVDFVDVYDENINSYL